LAQVILFRREIQRDDLADRVVVDLRLRLFAGRVETLTDSAVPRPRDVAGGLRRERRIFTDPHAPGDAVARVLENPSVGNALAAFAQAQAQALQVIIKEHEVDFASG